jgi:putative selenium metabolism protein SsnA
MIIIENAKVVNFYPASIEPAIDIVIDEGVIVDKGKNLKRLYPQARVVDSGTFVSPGLVCSHNHFYSQLSRGMMVNIKKSYDFVQQLNNLWWRLDRAIDYDITVDSSLSACAEAVMSGVTSVIDHHASPNFIDGSLDAIEQGFLTVGLRGDICYEVTDRNGIDGATRGINENVRYAKKVDKSLKEDKNFLLSSSIGAHASFTISDKTLENLADAVKSTSKGIHIHAAEDRFDSIDSRYRFKKNIIERLDDLQMLDSRSIIVHGVYLSDIDIDILNKRDGFLVHNCRSNMNNSVGYNDHISSFKNVALGTDGIGSDMLTELKFAYFKQRDVNGTLNPEDFVKMLISGNEILQRRFEGKKFGKIEKGYMADLVIWDYDSPTPLLPENLSAHLVFGLNSGNVKTVIINGKIVVMDKKPLFDYMGIMENSRKSAQRLWDNMNKLD